MESPIIRQMPVKIIRISILIISLFFLSCFEANAQQKSATALYLNSLGYVNVAEQDSSILVSLMYARSDNFTGKLLYNDLREAYLHKDAIAPLLKAQRLLHEVHPDYNLIIFDAARPMHVQQQMWDVVKGTRQQIYVSNPARGGGMHNYGLAVDISIADAQGDTIPMGTKVDHLGCAKQVLGHYPQNGGTSILSVVMLQERNTK